MHAHWIPGAVLGLVLWLAPAGRGAERVWDVRQSGAVGDGITLDTKALQAAVDAAGAAGGGVVRFPPGHYLSGTVHLRSRITLEFTAGARLVGTTNLAEYQHPSPPASLPESRWGTWHRALLLGDQVEDVTLIGPGVIDGNRVFDPKGEERMRGPHALLFLNSRRFTLRDLTFVDAANYAVLFFLSDDVEIRNVKFKGGWDGVHWRGAPDRWCRNVKIIGCQFYTGDDAIAGRYWDHTVISDCLVNSSCNGIRLIGPARRLLIADTVFYGPGEEPHLTSRERRRTNMLAAINLQPGAWDATRGPLDDVVISDVTMHDVSTPFHIVTKPGNTAGRITIQRVSATGAYLAAASVESWAETPIESVTFRDVTLEFTGGARADAVPRAVKGPGVDARPLPAWGFFARGVKRLVLEDVRLAVRSPDLRPVVLAEDVEDLVLTDLRHPGFPEVTQPVVWERPRTP